jgi:uncharacterized membrane protein YedE/YeeE
MKISTVSYLSGLIFGTGLVVGEMTRPDRVLGFLNIFGNWDPTLLFVMGGAVLTHMCLYPLIIRRSKPLLTNDWSIPDKKKITTSLIVGSFLFGIGWGLGGYCPGPGITAATTFHLKPVVFVISMLVGMFVFKLTSKPT